MVGEPYDARFYFDAAESDDPDDPDTSDVTEEPPPAPDEPPAEPESEPCVLGPVTVMTGCSEPDKFACATNRVISFGSWVSGSETTKLRLTNSMNDQMLEQTRSWALRRSVSSWRAHSVAR